MQAARPRIVPDMTGHPRLEPPGLFNFTTAAARDDIAVPSLWCVGVQRNLVAGGQSQWAETVGTGRALNCIPPSVRCVTGPAGCRQPPARWHLPTPGLPPGTTSA